MRKRKKIDSSTIVLSTIIAVFTIIIFLSLPVLFNYKSMQNEIENKFFSNFKINLKILDNISFRVLPRPHLLIKKANLDLNEENENSVIAEVEDIKLFIPSNKIYSKKNVIITDVKFGNLNLYLKIEDIKDIRDHLYFKINKPIIVSNIKIFLVNDKNDVILISPLKKVDYKINENFTAKELKLRGSIFDINFSSKWRREYAQPKSSINEIDLKNPKIFIKNLFTFENKKNFKGASSIDFLNENISFNYIYKDEKIEIFSPDKKKNQKIKFFSTIELNPFNFDGEIIFEEKKFNFITDNILNSIFNADKKFLKNLNGKLKLTLSKIDNKLFNNGKISLNINEGEIKVLNSFIEMHNIGIIETTYDYVLREGELFLESKNILNVNNQKKLAQKFQLNFKNVKDVKKVYFDFNKNIDTGDMFISNIYFNDKNSKNLLEEIIKINNMLVLKSTLRSILP